MCARSNPIQKLRVTVGYGLELTVTRVKSYGSLRCVFRHRNSVTTPEPGLGRNRCLGRVGRKVMFDTELSHLKTLPLEPYAASLGYFRDPVKSAEP